ncbi:MAG: hypothetical protein PUA56_00180 [Bacillales bacterium]|nr:hypothetical protein [Bacillales bacterium]
MEKKQNEDFDFDFDLKDEKPVYDPLKKTNTLDPHISKGDLINLGSFSLDLSDDCLIIRTSNYSSKTKVLIYLDEIQSTMVSKRSLMIFLFLAIIFLGVSIAVAVPLFFYYRVASYVVGGVGLTLAIISFIIYFKSKRLLLKIRYSNNHVFKRTISSINSFNRLNEFFDELYHRRSKLK